MAIEARQELHVWPADERHALSMACDCRPTKKKRVVHHRARDGRPMRSPNGRLAAGWEIKSVERS